MSFVVPDYDRAEMLRRRIATGGVALAIQSLVAVGFMVGLKVAYDRKVPPPPPIVVYTETIKPVPPQPPMPHKLEPVALPKSQWVAPVIEIKPDPVIDQKSTILTPVPDTQTIQGTGETPEYQKPVDPPVPVIQSASLDPRYRDMMQPPYPAAAERLGNEGRVILRVHVGSDGRILEALISVSSTFKVLDDAAKDYALKHWHLKPATRDGVPVDSRTVVPVLFNINKA